MCRRAVLHGFQGLLLFCYVAVSSVTAQVTLVSTNPLALEPGKSTRMTLLGSQLTAPLRVNASCAMNSEVLSVEGSQAVVDIVLPAGTPIGPIQLWIATPEGASDPVTLLVDDLPSVADSGANHTQVSAQEVPIGCGIDGASDAAQSDYFRFSATAGQRIAFEVVAQRMGSAMDAVVRILDSEGSEILTVDDDAVGPDCRFQHIFQNDASYILEIHDSRFAASGRYRLRIGDFPLVDYTYPLTASRGSKITCSFGGVDGAAIPPVDVDVPSDPKLHSISVPARFSDGKSSSWVNLGICDFPMVKEAETRSADGTEVPALSYPLGISGTLQQPGEMDSYRIVGVKGETIHVAARSRSLGSSSLVTMRLFGQSNDKIAEADVTDKDEWSFDATFDADGIYRLEVADLLKRGGPEFGYWIELTRPLPFEVTLRANAKTKTAFSVEADVGACAVDISVDRRGYDGAISLSLMDSASSDALCILNPLIPAGAKEARIYLVPTSAWKPDSSTEVRLVATSQGEPPFASMVGSEGLRRLKAPHVIFPSPEGNGLILATGVPSVSAYFEILPAEPIVFARSLLNNVLRLQLNRTNADFKEGLQFFGGELPPDWSLISKAEGDLYSIDIVRTAETTDLPTQITLQAYSEFQNRGRLTPVHVPLKWVDPVRITLLSEGPLIAGVNRTVRVTIERDGDDRQPLSLTWNSLPTGVSAPEKIDVAADQREVAIELQVGPDVVTSSQNPLIMSAATLFHGRSISTVSNSLSVSSIGLPERLEVIPNDIILSSPVDHRQLVVTGFDAADFPRDWTRETKLQSTNRDVAEVQDGIVMARGNGHAEIVVEIGNIRQTVPVHVLNFETRPPIQFENDVLAALSKQGCNSGACHGSPSGKGGFRLSLRGFDPVLDRETITREATGRRLNVVEPDQSLLLAKPRMLVPHGGGRRLREEDAAYATLRQWIAEGAKSNVSGTPKCLRLEVFPANHRVLNRAGGGQQLAVIAHFSDNTQQDVTALAAYESSNTSAAVVSPLGLVSPRGRGESAVLVRYLDHVESIRFMFVEDVPGFEWKAPPPANFIDDFVHQKLQQLQYLPAERCTDSDYLRRVYMDILGLLPTVDETRAFLQDTSEGKRERLVERLLERPEYAKFWALKWGDLLRATSKSIGDEGVHKYHVWVENAIRKNMPYDEFARLLLTSTGSTFVNPPANFFRTSSDTNDCVEAISQIFLGARLQCAKCHNHPYERWTQDNYYGLAAFFNRLQRRKTQRPGEMFIWTASSGDVTQPRTKEVMSPWLPGDEKVVVEGQEDRRTAFAAWLIRPENSYFARVEANRIWSQFFARGIVHPIDDFRDSNPPSNEPLLEALARAFIESGYDRKQLIRTIIASQTYQTSYRSSELNQNDGIYFSHHEPRMLGAERLLDAINVLLETDQTFGNLPLGTRATQMPAPDVVKIDFLKTLGQPERATVCACERTVESNLGMAIELFNGSLIREKLRAPNNRLHKAIAAGKSSAQVIEELYLAGLCRPPNEEELAISLAQCNSASNPALGLEDVCWAIINTDEFLFQH